MSLESRVPLLDHRVVELAWQFPYSMKVRNGQRKWVLRQVLERHVPRELTKRPKMGFGVPLDHWFRQELKELTHDVLLDGTAAQRGFFRQDVVERLVTEHESQQADHCYRLWSLLVLELWMRQWIDVQQPHSVAASVQ